MAVNDHVTGYIGQNQVDLNNAATEVTLRMILKASVATTAAQKAAVEQLAQRMGMDPVALAQLNQQLYQGSRATTRFGNSVAALIPGLSQISQKLFEGTAHTSDLFAIFPKMNGAIGLYVALMEKGILYLEQTMEAYQSISSIGAAFSGSLTDLRLAAAQSYVTLTEFGAILKDNKEGLTKLGSGVSQNIKTFAAMSKQLISSELGTHLMSLGYTTKEINSGLLKYINLSGARSASELKQVGATDRLAKSSAEYLDYLDSLARLTGKTRDQQQEALAEASKNAAWQAKLSTMTESERSKAVAGLTQSLAIGGKGAADAFQSKIMGIAPDKAGAMFMATQTATSDAILKSAEMVSDSSKSTADIRKQTKEALLAVRSDLEKYGGMGSTTLYAITRQGGLLADTLNQMGISANTINGMTEKDIDQLLKKMELQDSQAATMSEATKNIKEFTAALIELINPLAKALTPIIKGLSGLFSMLGTVITATLDGAGKLGGMFGPLGSDMAKLAVSLGGLVAILALINLTRRIPRGRRLPPLLGNNAPGAGRGGLAGSLGTGAAQLGRGAGRGLMGLARGLASLGSPRVMLGVVTLGLIGGALAVVGQGLKHFSGLDWKSVTVGTIALAAISAGAAVMGPFVPAILLGSLAIGALGVALALFGNGLKSFPQGMFDGIFEAFGSFGSVISGVYKSITGTLSSINTSLRDMRVALWDALTSPFKGAGQVLSDMASSVADGFGKIGPATMSVLSSIFDSLSSGYASAVDLVSKGIELAVNAAKNAAPIIKEAFSVVWDVITAPFKALWSLISKIRDLASTALSTTVGKAVGWAMDKLNQSTSPAPAAASNASGYADTSLIMKDAATSISEWVSKLKDVDMSIQYQPMLKGIEEAIRAALKEIAAMYPSNSTSNSAAKPENRADELVELIVSKLSSIASNTGDTAEQVKRSISAIKSLDGNLFR